LSSLKILSRRFQTSGDLLTAEVINILFSHLDGSKVPNHDLNSSRSPTMAINISDGTVMHPSQNILRAQNIVLGFENGFESTKELVERRRDIEPVLLAR